MKRIKSRIGKDGLASKVLKVKLVSKDLEGKNYIPYCAFGPHQGLILNEYVCQKRECKYYRRFYEK